METPLTLIYTHNIRGELALLPRMYTFMRRLRGELAAGRTLFIDLGASCDLDVWPCAITEGRSTLIVLDAMGYYAANVQGVLTPVSRARLAGQVTLHLVDDKHPQIDDGLAFVSAADIHVDPIQLRVVLAPADAATYAKGTLTLTALEAGQVGVARIAADGKLHHSLHDLPADTPPEPTISGAVEFVRGEARYFEKRQRGDEG